MSRGAHSPPTAQPPKTLKSTRPSNCYRLLRAEISSVSGDPRLSETAIATLIAHVLTAVDGAAVLWRGSPISTVTPTLAPALTPTSGFRKPRRARPAARPCDRWII